MTRSSALLLLLPAWAFSQPLGRDDADRFVRDLLWRGDSLISWFDDAGLAASRRLGIEYEGVDYKHLISYDVDDSVRKMITGRRAAYSVVLDSLQGDDARLTLTIDKAGARRQYYFKGRRCVSPLAYLTRDWPVVESETFRFTASDSGLLNAYGIRQLETFVERMASLLELSDRDLRTLRSAKIDYFLCRDEDEIERLTGFRARGMVNLAYDAIVSTYPDHYHELMHLLVNYKLRRLPLYTHPFLQEGLAVAFGGRGGTDPGVLSSLGSFLYRSEIVALPELLDRRGFEQLDASISYPACGLYNRYLVETRGMSSYLQLYRNHSGAFGDPAASRIAPGELASDSIWQLFVRSSAQDPAVVPESAMHGAGVVSEDRFARVSGDSSRYHFLLSGPVLLPSEEHFPGFVSGKFQELFPGKRYRGEKYLIQVDSAEIAIYNLLTGNLLASYAASFSLPPAKVPRLGGRYSFSVRKSIFDEPILRTLAVDEIEDKDQR